MVSSSRAAVSGLKATLEPRVQAFVHELKRLKLDFTQIYFYVDEDTNHLMVATMKVLESGGKAVLLTDHNTKVAGVYLLYHHQHQTQYHPLKEHHSLQEALQLAKTQGWDVHARTTYPMNS